jgi:plastocyanin
MKIRTSSLESSILMVVAVLLGTTVTVVSASSSLRSEVGSAAPASAKAAKGSDAEIQIDNFAFTPGAIVVKAGTQVTWINHDDIPHTVDSTEGKFKSGALDTDDKFEFRFAQPGEYPFYCRIHPKMTGKIVVQP